MLPCALPGCAGPGLPPRAASARQPTSAPTLPTLCARGAGSGAVCPRGCCCRAADGQRSYPEGRRWGGGCHGSGAATQARIPLGRGLSAPAPARVNNKAGAAAPDCYLARFNKVRLAAFAPPPPPPPAPDRITVCKMGRHGPNLRALWPLLHSRQYDVSFSFAKLLVSCKACSRPGAGRDGRVERRVLTGGSAEGRRARRA